MNMLRLQPIRDGFTGVALIALAVGLCYAIGDPARLFIWFLEVALVTAILAEAYAKDIQIHRYKTRDRVEDE